jgi:lysozyme family protein
MRQDIDEALKLIAGIEGGYSNHPQDPGGPTMKGVTLATYRAYCRRLGRAQPGIAELKAITDAEVEQIFRENYWQMIAGDHLPAGIDFAAADFSFNSGATQAVKELQRTVTALGFDSEGADGTVGAHTLSALDQAMRALGEDRVINAYMDRRWSFMQGLKNFASFKNGWRTRIKQVRANALAIAHGDPTYVPTPVAGASAKADPSETKLSAVPGGKSTIVTLGGAAASGATAAANALLDQTSYASDSHVLLYLIIGFVLLTAVGSAVTYVVLKNRPSAEASI